MKIIKIESLMLVCIIFLTSCKDFLQIPEPINQIGTEKVYQNDETATSSIRGIYAKMMTSKGFASGGGNSVTLLAGRSADDFINNNIQIVDWAQFSENNITPDNGQLSGLWRDTYQIIYGANAVLENLAISESRVSVASKEQLSGEAKFIRAFGYFYLTNLFGDVPLILATDYRKNAIASSTPASVIYNQVIKDLSEAKVQMSENYPSADRTRANKWAATALLARVYLYKQEWEKAETEASLVINQSTKYVLVPDLNRVFLKNSQEAVLQFFVPTQNNVNTFEGGVFILTAPPTTSTQVVLDQNLVNAFEAGDLRRTQWIGTITSGSSSWYYPFKYKVPSGSTSPTEFSMVLRLAEQYLIRAEARINQNKIELGIADLNRIRQRPLSNGIPSNPIVALPLNLSKSDALLAVEKERRMELFSEWAHRWLDLKRTNRATAVLSPIKGSNWQSTDVLFPIPASELLNNKNLTPNPGY